MCPNDKDKDSTFVLLTLVNANFTKWNRIIFTLKDCQKNGGQVKIMFHS